MLPYRKLVPCMHRLVMFCGLYTGAACFKCCHNEPWPLWPLWPLWPVTLFLLIEPTISINQLSARCYANAHSYSQTAETSMCDSLMLMLSSEHLRPIADNNLSHDTTCKQLRNKINCDEIFTKTIRLKWEKWKIQTINKNRKFKSKLINIKVKLVWGIS